MNRFATLCRDGKSAQHIKLNALEKFFEVPPGGLDPRNYSRMPHCLPVDIFVITLQVPMPSSYY